MLTLDFLSTYVTYDSLTRFKPVLRLCRNQSCDYIETSPLIWSANQWTGFYKIATLGWDGLTYVTYDLLLTYAYSSTDSFSSPIPVSDMLIFCWVNLSNSKKMPRKHM